MSFVWVCGSGSWIDWGQIGAGLGTRLIFDRGDDDNGDEDGGGGVSDYQAAQDDWGQIKGGGSSV